MRNSAHFRDIEGKTVGSKSGREKLDGGVYGLSGVSFALHASRLTVYAVVKGWEELVDENLRKSLLQVDIGIQVKQFQGIAVFG